MLERGRTALCYRQLCQGCLTWVRPWKCSSAIQTSREVAQEQIRRLTKKQGSSKTHPSSGQCTPIHLHEACKLQGAPLQRKFRAASSPRKARTTVTKWDIPTALQ